jgi:glycosyltransferase involved in cell wall biosynthesis
MVGLHPVKRVYEVVLQIAQMHSRGYPFQLRIAGRRNPRFLRYARAIETLVAKLGLTGSVAFDGFVEDMPGWYESIDVFISNSYWEGQPLSLLEAMASGCYCLSHCWDGAEEVLPDENIFATDSDLRAKLISYAGLPRAEKRQAQARMRAIAEEKFDERRMVREIIDLIESVGAR